MCLLTIVASVFYLVLGKCIRLLSNIILFYCELCNILVDEQNGFRKNRSCNDHIFSLSSIIRNRVNNGKPTFAAFLDIEKTSNKVDRYLLLLRL